MRGGRVASGVWAVVCLGLAVGVGRGESIARINLSPTGSQTFSSQDPVKVKNSFAESGTYDFAPFFGYHWAVSGEANLETGVVRGKALSSVWDNTLFTNFISEDIVIHGAPGTTAMVEFDFHVDGGGDLDDIGDANREFVLDAQLDTSLAGAKLPKRARYQHHWGLFTFGLGGSEVFEVTPTTQNGGEVEVITAQKGVFDVILKAVWEVPIQADGQSFPMNFTGRLIGRASASSFPGGGLAILDASHTGRAGVILEEGYTFTSGSGVFLSKPVPEPTAGGVLVLMGSMLVWRRR